MKDLLKTALKTLPFAGVAFVLGCAVIGMADLTASDARLWFIFWAGACLTGWMVAVEELRGDK